MSAPRCRNCDAPLAGKYCSACGQRDRDLRLTVGHFLHDATHEFLHLDGKIVQTLKLLALRPGALTAEFLAGRRARFISPIRMYLTVSILFFALAAMLPGQSSFIQIRATPDPPGTSRDAPAPGGVEHAIEAAAARAAADADGFRDAILHNLPRVAFVLVPVFAALTWLFYRRAQPYYVPHLYYAIHFHAFVFLVLCVQALLAALGERGRQAGTAVFAATVFPYHYIALRRVFGGSRVQTAVRGTAAGFLYFIAIGLAMAGLMGFLLFQR